jgi:hypothetical protein
MLPPRRCAPSPPRGSERFFGRPCKAVMLPPRRCAPSPREGSERFFGRPCKALKPARLASAASAGGRWNP